MVLTKWPLDPVILLGLGVVAALYLHAGRIVTRRSGDRRIRPWRRRFFLAGLVTIFAALQSPLDVGAEATLTAHMIQHLLLTMVAAPLLVLGAPVTLALQAWPRAGRRRVLAALHSPPLLVLSNPLVAWSLFFGAMWATHLTGVYEAALRSERIHAIEHVAYLTTALLFWIPPVGVEPTLSGLSHPARILYLFLAMPAMAFLGLAIFSADRVLYPTYAATEGVSRALGDQRVAGALMWNAGMALIVPALAFVLLDWMRADDREARRVDERLVRLEGASVIEEGSGP